MSVCVGKYTCIRMHTDMNVYVDMYQHIHICMKDQKARVFEVH